MKEQERNQVKRYKKAFPEKAFGFTDEQILTFVKTFKRNYEENERKFNKILKNCLGGLK